MGYLAITVNVLAPSALVFACIGLCRLGFISRGVAWGYTLLVLVVFGGILWHMAETAV